MGKIFKSAIVGCGGIARVHAKVLDSMENVDLLYFCDIKEDRAENFKNQYGGEVFTDFDTMINTVDIDVVHVCTPHYLHTPMVKACEAKGIAVFTEKPPVISYAQLADFMSTDKVPVGICFQNRYNKEFVYLKNLIESGKAGKVLGARALVTWCRGEKYYVDSGWRGKLATEGGGALINQTIHTLDLLVQLFGKPQRVEALASNWHLQDVIEVEDNLQAYLDYGDKTALFYATTAYSTDSPVLIDVNCENMNIRYEKGITITYKNGEKEVVDFNDVDETLGKGYWGNGHSKCINDYYDKIEKGEKPTISPKDVEITANLMLEIYKKVRGKADNEDVI